MSNKLLNDPHFISRVTAVCAACESIRDDNLDAYAYVASKARDALANNHARKLRDALELVAIGLDVRNRNGDTSHGVLEREVVDLAETIRRALENEQ